MLLSKGELDHLVLAWFYFFSNTLLWQGEAINSGGAPYTVLREKSRLVCLESVFFAVPICCLSLMSNVWEIT